MAKLDYAYLADFAKVEPAGVITAVGASFTHRAVERFPIQQLLAVAGRVRAKLGEEPTELQVSLRHGDTGSDRYEINVGVTLGDGESARPYGNDNVGRLFAITLLIPLPAPGLYEAMVLIGEEVVRRLAFVAELAPPT